MVIYVDIDDTICVTKRNKMGEYDYHDAEPIYENIKKINDLFDKGYEIVYWTARGSLTGKDWMNLTVSQFKKWGVKYHLLKMGKPYYDLFIDDKAISSIEGVDNYVKKIR